MPVGHNWWSVQSEMLHRFRPALLLLVILVLAACSDDGQATLAPTAGVVGASETVPASSGAVPTAADPTAEASPTPVPATPTPSEPLAAMANGRPIFLDDYEKELARYEQAQSELGLVAGQDGTDNRNLVLNALIETELIAQAAEVNGLVVTEEMVDMRLADLEMAAGGPENFTAWLDANQWTPEEFREALAGEMLTELVVEFVTADVPTAVEQVRASYVQLDDAVLAQSIVDQARGGADFAALARQYSVDRMTGENGGDLGFFAQGSLLVPELEEAAFSLQPGEISEVITAARADGAGTAFYVVTVTERDPQRELNAELRFNLLQQRFEAWLSELWAQAEISRFVDGG
jgi:parvulin-like peptidyl-prolyl isomerase